MKRSYLIILCLLSLLLINSCTTETLSSSSKAPATSEETTQVAESQDTNASESNQAADTSAQNTPETVTTQDVVRVEQSEPDTTPVGTTGSKQITITIVDREGNSRDETISTEAGDLLTALKTSGKGSDSTETPGYIVTVGDKTADASKYEWWQISKDGTLLSDSAERTPITDGEHYTFSLQGPE